MTDAWHYGFPDDPIREFFQLGAYCGPGLSIIEPVYIHGYFLTNNIPYTAEVIVEWQFPDRGQAGTITHTLEPDERITQAVPAGLHTPCTENKIIRITDAKLVNMTGTEIFELYTKAFNFEERAKALVEALKSMRNEIDHLENELESVPTAFYGTITTNNGVGTDIEVIVVNVANHTDVKRDTTNSEGDYFIRTEPGNYLVQAIGGGPDSYEYTTISNHDVKQVNLRYN